MSRPVTAATGVSSGSSGAWSSSSSSSAAARGGGARRANLLGTVGYWDARYAAAFAAFKEKAPAQQREEGILYDWYLEPAKALELIVPYLETHKGRRSRVLILGCGLSDVGPELYRRGYKNVVNVDFSATVIARMQREFADHEGLQFSVLDVANLGPFGDEYFDFIFDKGCIDAVMCGNSSVDAVHAAYEEISRVLADQGHFVSVSYGEPLTRNPYLKKAEFKWLSTTHTILNAEGDLKFQVYTQRKDLEEFRPPPPPMKLGPCLAAFGVGEQLETFTEADVFTVEQARKLSQLQLVLLGVPEDDCPRLLEHIAGWEGDAEEAAKKKKLEKEAKKRAKLKEKLRAGEEGGSGDEGSVSSDGTSSSSSDDDD